MARELKFQSECFLWFHNNHLAHIGRLRRIKNELDNHPYKKPGDRMKQLGENKATGVRPGDSDFYWIGGRITFIELKVDGNIQQPEQKDFQLMVTSFGHRYVIIRTIEEFKKLIIFLLNEEK